MIRISYTTEISKPYVDALKKCKSLDDLRNFIKEWKEIACDAFEQIESSSFDWKEYQKGCKLEKRGKFAGHEWAGKYGAILLPAIIMFVGIKAIQFHAPEGTVFIRAQELKAIKKRKDGTYYLDLPKE